MHLVAAQILLHGCALAVAVFGDGQQAFIHIRDRRADNSVTRLQTDAANADGHTTHAAHVVFVEADRHAVVCGKQNVVLTGRVQNGDQLIALVDGQHADAGLSGGIDFAHLHTLDGAVSCNHHDIFIFGEVACQQHCGNLFLRLKRQDVCNMAALGGASGFGNHITLEPMDASRIRKEEQIVMCRCHEQMLDVILFLQALTGNASAAAFLCAVGVYRQALDIAAVGEGVAAFALLDQILILDLIDHVHDLGAALIAVLVTDGGQFVLQNALDQIDIAENTLKISDFLFQLLIFVLELFTFQTLQRLQTHIENGLRLNVAQTEALHQLFFSVVIGAADDLYNFVDMVLRDQQTF